MKCGMVCEQLWYMHMTSLYPALISCYTTIDYLSFRKSLKHRFYEDVLSRHERMYDIGCNW